MTTVSTLQTNSNTYTYDEFCTLVNSGQVSTDDIDDVTVFSASTDSSQCTDGEDDGKIGIGSALLNIGKGILNGAKSMITGAFTDSDGNFSLTQTLKTAGITALCFVPGVGQFVAAGLCAYGCVTGAVGLANGIYSYATADTDAEAKEACQSIGTSGLTLGLSAYGMKKVGSAIKDTYYNGNSSTGSDLTNVSQSEGTLLEKAGQIKDNVVTEMKGYYGNSWKTGTTASYKKSGLTDESGNITTENASTWQKVKAGASGAKSVAKQAVKGTAQNIYNTYESIKEEATNKIDKLKTKNLSEAEYNEALSNAKKQSTAVKNADGSTTTKIQLEDGSIQELTKSADGKYTKKTVSGKNSNVTLNEDGTTTTKTKSGESTTETLKDVDGNVLKESMNDGKGNTKTTTGDTTIAEYENGGKVTTKKTGTTTKIEANDLATETVQSTLQKTYGISEAEAKTLTTSNVTDAVSGKSGVKITSSSSNGSVKVTIEAPETLSTKASTFASNVKNGQYNTTINTITNSDGYEVASSAGTVIEASECYAANHLSENTTALQYDATMQSASTIGAITLSTVPELLADETIDSMKDISNASTTYVTTSGTTGVEYTLQDYSLPTEEEVDQTYAEIYGSALQI